MHALVMNLTADSPSLQQNQDQAEAPVTPCELSAKSLMAVPPMLLKGRCWLSPCCWRAGGDPAAYRTPVASPRYLLTPIAGASAIMHLP
ncbi:suppression of copper sensitivity: putative copper binding protein ScsA [Klebsiella pneumoniae]|uniref:Suppression of copper sensitivity: putative copper binding protein ScsA n=1 Tax=Klebsiella pneumoniae TaxID=573 RepID=A0A377WRD1_KLEPN|nr:suppression of copper sensitivity: putative copper binding protein ScsA [Klebsiella pneumoniae]